MPKRVLVTGACGFTGSHMVERLHEAGYEVIATDLERSAHAEYYCEQGHLHPIYIEDHLKKLGVKFIPADLTDADSLEAVFKNDSYWAVFNVASMYDYFASLDMLRKVNVDGTRNLAQLCVDYKVGHFLHWSTDGVYGEIENPPGDENHPFNPPNSYSISKVEQEKMLWGFHADQGLPLTVLRPAPIYGPNHRYGVFHILYTLQKMGSAFVLSLWPKKHKLMIPSVHVTDLVNAALHLAENKEKCLGEAYNILSDCIAQEDFMEFIFKALGVPYKRIPVPWPIYKYGAERAMKMTKRLDERARAHGTRPKIDVPMIEYVTHQYWFDNRKIKDLGFKFKYTDPRPGIWDYITWCREKGWLE